MDEKKRFEDDLDIKWEMDLERDKKARERIFGDVDDIKLVNDKIPENLLDKEDSEIILKESLDGYEKDVLRSSQKDIYNKFGGDTETFEPSEDIEFEDNDVMADARDSVSFFKDVPEYETEAEAVPIPMPRKPAVKEKYKEEPNKMKIVAISVIILLLCVLAALVNKINTLNAKSDKEIGTETVLNADNETIQILTEKNKILSDDVATLRSNIADMMASSGGEAIQPTEVPTEKPLETLTPTEAPVVAVAPVTVQTPAPTKNTQQSSSVKPAATQAPATMTRAEEERNSVLTKDVKYTVVKGDSLIRLSKRFYGDSKLYTKIKEANGLTEEELYMGQKIIIPKK